jgi:hypothetical protein
MIKTTRRSIRGGWLGAWCLFAGLIPDGAAIAQKIPANYEESQVGEYTLPDPLVLAGGQPVSDARTWYEERRPEILRLFETNVYGRSPDRPGGLRFEVFDRDRQALGGKAVRKQVAIHFTENKDGPVPNLLLYMPTGARGPVPVLLVLSFTGNHRVSPEKAIRLPEEWDRRTKEKQRAAEESRASENARELDLALARGYAFASICYNEIEPDFVGGIGHGVRPLFFKPGQSAPGPEDWGAIAAWGWALSRVLDYFETDPDIDARRVAIVGHSRLGKTVLWAGARDPRFAMVIASGSGEGGAALSRRNYGETVKHLITSFPHWFCTNYQKYADRVADLPVDQHMLLALIAPRPLYLATAEDDRWADPKGEFLAARAAEPIYNLLGRKGLEVEEMPPLNQPIMNTIGFHYRPGQHAVTPYEWDRYLEFADRYLKPSPSRTSASGE